MHRITITIEDDLLEQVEALAARYGNQKRSEVIRDLVRRALQQTEHETDSPGACAAALVCVYDIPARASRWPTQRFGEYQDMSLATLQLRLDDARCMEVAAFNGCADDVRRLADHMIGERGVRYGRLVMIPAAVRKKRRSARKRNSRRHK